MVLKKIVSMIIILLCLPFVFAFYAGDGSVGDPYQINSWTDLNETRADLTANYILINNLSSIDGDYINLGDSWVPIGGPGNQFTGNFDGQGNTISDLTINSPGTSYVALFGSVLNSNIQNIGLLKVSITGDNYAAGLVAWQDYGMINNSYVTGTITGLLSTGGMLGGGDESAIYNSYAIVTVTGMDETGGLAGHCSYVHDSYSIGNVTGNVAVGGLVGWQYGITNRSNSTANVVGINYVGGLIGWQDSTISTIIDSYATGDVSIVPESGGVGIGGLVGILYGGLNNSYATGNVTGSEYIGGLVGHSPGVLITKSYATGNINGVNYVGGLVGFQETGLIENSYATGDVTGSNVVIGGLVGVSYAAINASYSIGSVTGAGDVGGLVGSTIGTIDNSYWNTETSGQPTSAGGTGKTTTEMKDILTYLGWDIIPTTINLNNGYPYFGWQISDNSTVWFLYTATTTKIVFRNFQSMSINNLFCYQFYLGGNEQCIDETIWQDLLNASNLYYKINNPASWENYAVCYLNDGSLGHCTDAVGESGMCTCASN